MNEHEQQVFSAALDRLNIKTIDAPRLFGVTRQTLSCWMRGKTKIPKEAFVTMLEIENGTHTKTRERMEEIAATVERLKSKPLATKYPVNRKLCMKKE